MRRCLWIPLLALTLSGCFKLDYKMTPPKLPTYSHEVWNQFFLWGFVRATEEHDVGALCGVDKVVEVRTEFSPANFFASIFSLGLATSSMIEIDCAREDLSAEADSKGSFFSGIVGGKGNDSFLRSFKWK